MPKRPESPTARAAKALALMNKKPDSDMPVVPYDSDSIYAFPEREVYEDQARLEGEMNQMFKELTDMENMIKGNRDLKAMDTLKDTTKEVIDAHIKHYDKLKEDIIKINEKAEDAIDGLNFYGTHDELEPSDNPKEGEAKRRKGYRLPAGIKDLEVVDEDDEADVMIAAGGKKISHEAQKKAMFDQFDFMGRSMREFTADIEKRLDDVYKGGAAYKFGIDDVASESSKSEFGGGFQPHASRSKKSHRDREVDRIEKEAQDFFKKVGIPTDGKQNNDDLDDVQS